MAPRCGVDAVTHEAMTMKRETGTTPLDHQASESIHPQRVGLAKMLWMLSLALRRAQTILKLRALSSYHCGVFKNMHEGWRCAGMVTNMRDISPFCIVYSEHFKNMISNMLRFPKIRFVLHGLGFSWIIWNNLLSPKSRIIGLGVMVTSTKSEKHANRDCSGSPKVKYKSY